MTTHPLRPLLLTAAMLTGLAATVVAPVAATATQTDEEIVLQKYERSIRDYVRLRRTLEWWVLPDEGIAGERVGSVEILAARIREARRGARRGDVFTPDVDALIRLRIDQALQSAEAEGDAGPLLPAPPQHLHPKVNGTLPPGAGERTWISLIPELPPLEDGLEYRFIGRDLVLFDAGPNVIVDVLPNAFAPGMHQRP